MLIFIMKLQDIKDMMIMIYGNLFILILLKLKTFTINLNFRIHILLLMVIQLLLEIFGQDGHYIHIFLNINQLRNKKFHYTVFQEMV